jgi:hypothetical protein
LPSSQINTALPPADTTSSQFWKSSFRSWGVLLGEGDLIDQPVRPSRVSDVLDALGVDHAADHGVTELTSLLFTSLYNNLCNRITVATRWQHVTAGSASNLSVVR